jgi:peroxiredoxin
MIATTLGTLLPWVMVGIGAWVIHRLAREQRMLLARLNAIDQQFGRVSSFVQRRQMRDSLGQFLREQNEPAPEAELPLDSVAADFELPDLSGGRHKLQDFRGRNVLLVLFNPECGFCVQMAPELAQLPVDGAGGRAIPVVVATGPIEANRKLFDEHKVPCLVLYDPEGTVAKLYKTARTPTGYLINAEGKIASALAAGSPELLSLADPDEEPLATPKDVNPAVPGKANRGLGASKLIRDGLKRGAVAPSFRLPRLGGGEMALEDLRGKHLLLVFSDPECGPCTALAPQLERIHRETPAVQVVLISRRDEEANRKKVAELGLTFPVLLQKQWEISKLYGMFATPVGYLIDADGTIVHDAAKGAGAILDLPRSLSAAATPPPAQAA